MIQSEDEVQPGYSIECSLRRNMPHTEICSCRVLELSCADSTRAIYRYQPTRLDGRTLAHFCDRAGLAPGGIVKIRNSSLSFLATLALAGGMISWGTALNAQTTPSTPSQTQQPETQP